MHFMSCKIPNKTQQILEMHPSFCNQIKKPMQDLHGFCGCVYTGWTLFSS